MIQPPDQTLKGIRSFPPGLSSLKLISYLGGDNLWIQLLFKHRITFINSNIHLQKERI